MKLTQRLSKDKRGRLKRRHLRIRKRVVGTPERPRLMIRKTLKHLYAQVIDDSPSGGSITVVSFSTKEKGQDPKKNYINVENATKLGKQVGEALKSRGIETVVFDRGGYRYHGRVKAFCEAVREAGIRI